MAKFYGEIQGSRGKATRLGTQASGLTVTAASWEGSVRVTLETRSDGTKHAYVALEPWKGAGAYVILYDGPVSGEGAEQYMLDRAAAIVVDTMLPNKEK